jgi:hypothetical protein
LIGIPIGWHCQLYATVTPWAVRMRVSRGGG